MPKGPGKYRHFVAFGKSIGNWRVGQLRQTLLFDEEQAIAVPPVQLMGAVAKYQEFFLQGSQRIILLDERLRYTKAKLPRSGKSGNTHGAKIPNLGLTGIAIQIEIQGHGTQDK